MQFGSGVILQEEAGSTADTGARAPAGAAIDNGAALVPGQGPRSAADGPRSPASRAASWSASAAMARCA
jgi:hypothetical protein